MKKGEFERNFDLLVHDIARLIRKSVDIKVRTMGLTRSQWMILAYLQHYPGITQTELADILDMGKANLGELMDKLEDKGWVVRRAHPQDRRAKIVEMTEKAWPVVELMNRLGTELRQSNLSVLSPSEQNQLVDLLIKVKQRTANNYAEIAARAEAGAEIHELIPTSRAAASKRR